MFNHVHGEFASFWLAAGDSSGVPKKADIDPASFPPRILPHLALWDVVTLLPETSASSGDSVPSQNTDDGEPRGDGPRW